MASFSQPRDWAVSLFMLAFAWWLTVGMAYAAIRRRRIEAHKEWMVRSYVVTFAFVTFRYLEPLSVWDPLGGARGSTVLWLSWVFPLLIAEVILQWPRTIGGKGRSTNSHAAI